MLVFELMHVLVILSAQLSYMQQASLHVCSLYTAKSYNINCSRQTPSLHTLTMQCTIPSGMPQSLESQWFGASGRSCHPSQKGWYVVLNTDSVSPNCSKTRQIPKSLSVSCMAYRTLHTSHASYTNQHNTPRSQNR